ncbi:response regulator transcription factor [Candidatus Dojkabacteria bacterium]|nr:response regulator transcription factor [Candidatus Dojkabacteria bacterium]
MKILLVEDEIALRKPVKRYLEGKKFEVDEAGDGNQVLELVSLNEYDCILLDLNIPEIDGIEVCKRLRTDGNPTPVIMLTARSQMYDKLEGLDCGADDYITKPFNLKEVVARINSVIRRNSLNKTVTLTLEDWEINEGNNTARNSKTQKTIELSNKEIGILIFLIRNKGSIVSPEILLEHVWDSQINGFSDTVKTHIKTLRKKIDPNKTLIRTVKGKGYIV